MRHKSASSRKGYVFVKINDGGALMRLPRHEARAVVEGLKTCVYASRRVGRAFERTEDERTAAIAHALTQN